MHNVTCSVRATQAASTIPSHVWPAAPPDAHPPVTHAPTHSRARTHARTRAGKPCWEGEYTRERCCVATTLAVTQPTAQWRRDQLFGACRRRAEGQTESGGSVGLGDTRLLFFGSTTGPRRFFVGMRRDGEERHAVGPMRQAAVATGVGINPLSVSSPSRFQVAGVSVVIFKKKPTFAPRHPPAVCFEASWVWAQG